MTEEQKAIDVAKFVFSDCWECVGCNKLENPNFVGEKNCKNSVIRKFRITEERGVKTWLSTAI